MISNPLAPNPTQLMAKLRMMPDQELFQYAQLHQSDPYVFPLTFQESNARKAARASQQMQPGQPPKVVQQDLQQMAPQRAAPRMGGAGAAMPDQMAQAATQPQQALPEDQGIGQLPAQNMQGMAEGGIVGYAPGGQTMGPGTPADYREYALEKAAKMGLNPAFVDRILKIESGYDPYAHSGSGSTGIGQLVKSTAQSYGLKVPPPKVKTDDPTRDERLNPIMNIDASLAYMADLNKKYKGNPELMAVAYNQGEPTLDAHLRNNGGKLVPEKLQQDIAANLTAANANKKPKDQLTDAQIAARAAEPVNYLNKLNNTAIPNEASLSKGESVVPPTQAVDSSIPTNYKQEQATTQAAYDAEVNRLKNESFLDKSKRVGRGLVGWGEAGLSTLGGMTTYPTAAIAAAAQNPKGAKDAAQGLATPEAAAYYKLMDDLRSQATYAPRMPEGQEILDTVNKVAEGLPPYMGTMVGAKPTQLRTTAAPKAVTKPGLPALKESQAAKAAEAAAPAQAPATTPKEGWQQLPLFPELENAPTAEAPAQQPTGKPPFAQGTQMELPFNQPEALPPEVANVRPGVENGNVPPPAVAARAPVQGELFPETPGGKAFPIDPEAAGIAAVQRARLAKERAAAEAAAKEEPVAKPVEAAVPPVEETPSAMTPEEMLDRAQKYDLDKKKADIIRNSQTAVKAGLPGLVNPVTTTPPATTAPEYKPPFMPNAMTMESADSNPPSEETEAAPDISDVKRDAKTGGMDWNDLMIKMGLGMMAGKSPNAITNVGEAGLGALQMTAAEKKAAAEQQLHEAQAEMYRQHGTLYGAMPDIKAQQLSAKERMTADANVEKAVALAMKANPFAYQTIESQTMLRSKLRSDAYDLMLSNKTAGGAAPAASVTVPDNVSVRRTG